MTYDPTQDVDGQGVAGQIFESDLWAGELKANLFAVLAV